MKRLTLTLAPVTLLALLASCGPLDDTEAESDVAALAEDSGEASESGDTANALNSIPVEPITDPTQLGSPESAAQAAGTAPTFFKPAGCIVATRAAGVVTYEFKGCTGPFGLVGVNGKLVATFSPAAVGTLAVAVKSDGLVIGKTPVEHSASGTISFKGTQRIVAWTSTTKGILARSGAAIEHKASYSGTYDVATECVALDGTASTTWGIHGVQSTVVGYQRCGSGGVCPTAGTITATGLLSKLSITITYLGNGRAQLTTPKGRVFDYKMAWCAVP